MEKQRLSSKTHYNKLEEELEEVILACDTGGMACLPVSHKIQILKRLFANAG
jgi:hypothetical protein